MASSSSRAASQIVVVMGAGPGTGQSLAKLFAQAGHPVAILSRTLSKLQTQADEINALVKQSDRVRPFAADATDEAAVKKAFSEIQESFKPAKIFTGIFNPTGGFAMGDFEKTTLSDLRNALDCQVVGSFIFAKAFMEAVQSNGDWQKPPAPGQASGNLFFTGATASIRGGPRSSAFAAAKTGLRAFSQSLARQYHPQNVHVAHFVIDGIIDTERVAGFLGEKFEPDTRMDPDAIAQVYLDVARQQRSAWTHELDLRPFSEKF